MIIIDLTNAITIVLLLMATLLIIFLAKQSKKGSIVALPLAAFLILLAVHVTQLLMVSSETGAIRSTLMWSIIVDFAFIALTFVSYVWVDDIETKTMASKSTKRNLDWFWKEI